MKKSLVIFVGLLCCVVMGKAQQQELDPATQFAATITPQDLQGHIYFLADDLLEGRETGERGQYLAALYIKTRFMRYGLKPIVEGNQFYQMYYMNRAELNEANLKLGEQELKFRQDFFGLGTDMPDALSGKLTFAGFGIQTEDYDNLQSVKLAGKIAVALAGSPDNARETPKRLYDQVRSWQSRRDAIEAAGGKGLVMIVPDSTYKTVSRYARTRSMTIDDGSAPKIPVLYVKESIAADLFAKSKASFAELHQAMATDAQIPKIKFKETLSFTADISRTSTPAMNVLGYLEGSEYPDELLVITGHYDHIGLKNDGTVNNGANDDASGTSGVLEVAEAFASAAMAGHRPKRSILFMTVSGEEKGLLGSEFYAEHPILPLENTIVNLNIDMIGRVGKEYYSSPDSANYIYVIGADKLSSELHVINEAANAAHTQMLLDYKYNDENDPNRFYYRSDHYNFAKNGIPVIFYFNGTHMDYHKPGDDPEKINYELAAKTTRLVFHTAWELANREKRIVVDKEGK